VTAAILRLHWLLSVLLVIATVLFAVGVATERADGDDHDEDVSSATHVEAGEGEQQDEGAESADTESGEHDEETTFGIDRERPAIVVPAVILSLALAVLVWFRRDMWLLWTVVVFALLFTAFDVAEVVHQLSEDRGGLALLAAIVALLHLAAAFVAETRATHPLARKA
jgi:hypothetical protein